MVSVRIEAETPEEVASLLRGLVTGSGKSGVIEAIRESEGEFVKFVSDALSSKGESTHC